MSTISGATLSASQLAELAPCPPEDVHRLSELGILEPDADGQYTSADAHVIRLMAAFEEAHISLEDVARGVAAGEVSFPMGRFMPEAVGITETYDRLAARLDRSPEFLRRLSIELGVPPCANDGIRSEDAEMLSLIVTKLDLADEDELSRFARLYGGTAQRLVSSGLQFFDLAVRQRVATFDLPSAAIGSTRSSSTSSA